MNAGEALDALRSFADPNRRPGMARVGINVERALGVSVPNIRRIARSCGRDRMVAEALWDSQVHEARILATLVADPAALDAPTIERWVTDLDSWDVCDFAADLFCDTKHAARSIRFWARRPEPYVKRCAFSMIARQAVREKAWPDERFESAFPLIRRAATDDRNEVRKAVNWSLRQIGKRNRRLRLLAIREAEAMLEQDSRTARWIARDALRELRDPKVVARVGP